MSFIILFIQNRRVMHDDESTCLIVPHEKSKPTFVNRISTLLHKRSSRDERVLFYIVTHLIMHVTKNYIDRDVL